MRVSLAVTAQEISISVKLKIESRKMEATCRLPFCLVPADGSAPGVSLRTLFRCLLGPGSAAATRRLFADGSLVQVSRYGLGRRETRAPPQSTERTGKDMHIGRDAVT